MTTTPAHTIDLAQPISILQERLTSVQTRLAEQTESAPELINLVDRLTQLIEQTAQEERRLAEAAAKRRDSKVRRSAVANR
jgi:hypothetical protein